MARKHELLMRLLLGILYLIVLNFLTSIIAILWIVQVIIVVFTKNTNRGITKVTKMYVDFVKDIFYYIGFITEKKPFPFDEKKK